MIDVALVSAHPTEAEARDILSDGGRLAIGTYLGVWTMPLPYGGRVHVFMDRTFAELEAIGWTRETEA